MGWIHSAHHPAFGAKTGHNQAVDDRISTDTHIAVCIITSADRVSTLLQKYYALGQQQIKQGRYLH